MDVQNPEKVSAILVKSLNTIVTKMNKTKSLMIGIKSKYGIKLNIVRLDKSEAYSEENVLPENGLYRYLY